MCTELRCNTLKIRLLYIHGSVFKRLEENSVNISELTVWQWFRCTGNSINIFHAISYLYCMHLTTTCTCHLVLSLSLPLSLPPLSLIVEFDVWKCLSHSKSLNLFANLSLSLSEWLSLSKHTHKHYMHFFCWFTQ